MIGTHIEAILIVTGAITAGFLVQFLAPAPVVRVLVGEARKDLPSLALARHWGLLNFPVGALLGYAAFEVPVRGPPVLLATIDKIAIGSGVLGTQLLHYPPLSCDRRRGRVHCASLRAISGWILGTRRTAWRRHPIGARAHFSTFSGTSG